MKRLILSALLCAVLIFSASAADKMQVAAKWKQLKPSFFTLDPYTVTPSADETWSEGALKDGFTRDGLNYLNFCRFVAGLDEVEYDADKAPAMQKAALLYSSDVFSDEETKPVGMTDIFYAEARGTLDASYTAFGFDNLEQSVGGLVNSRAANMVDVAPRTALLSPAAESVGFGFYDGYAAVSVEFSDEVEYDYVAWPSAEAFPTMLMKDSLPWSITLNPARYSAPQLEDIRVRLEVPALQKVIELSAVGEYSYYNDTAEYMNVNSATNTVIFKPSNALLASWLDAGDVDVRVTLYGIYTADGQETSIQYTVNFFDLDDAVLSAYSDASSVAAHQKAAVAQVSLNEVFVGYEDGTFRPHEEITRAEFTVALLRYMNIEPSDETDSAFSDVDADYWAAGYINAAAQMGAVHGTDPGIFSPEETVTAEQALKIVTVVKGFTDKIDIEASGGYPYAYYNLGYELGIMDYIDDNDDFEYHLTRSDAAQIIYNASSITAFWTEQYYDRTIIWHRDRTGKGYGYYSFVKFK